VGSGFGAGLYVAVGVSDNVTLTGDTVQGNNAQAGTGSGTPGVGEGGGIYNATTGAALLLDSATVAQVTGNTASSGAAFDNIVGPYTLT
jgi:hypothetical protein